MSKLHFNIGVCCCNLFDYERAVTSSDLFNRNWHLVKR